MASLAPAAALAVNVTLDDFDAVFTYSDDKSFTTNDPSKNETFYARFHDGTVHITSSPSAYVNLSFVGTDIYLYGSSGPSSGSYSVTLDGQTALSSSAYAAENSTLPYLLYSASNLSAIEAHSLQLTNLGNEGNTTIGPDLLFDYALLTVPIAVQGATLTNTTVENNSDRLVYTGHWDSNSDVVFSGGTTSYTNASGASVSLTFNGSAIYVFGDANNDHYAFNVTLDGATITSHTPLGCGGEFEPHACEKIVPGLQFFAGPLNASEHTITVTNYVVSNFSYSYFDLDRFVYTTPSQYLNTTPMVPGIRVGSGSSASETQSGTGPIPASAGTGAGRKINASICTLLLGLAIAISL